MFNGTQHYLWRAVDHDGEVVDVYLQAKRDGVGRLLEARVLGFLGPEELTCHLVS